MPDYLVAQNHAVAPEGDIKGNIKFTIIADRKSVV
jgi:hypothetical protein